APDTSSIKGTEAEGVDVLGFTAGQWEDVFHKLDTTEGKIQAVGMAMQALSNAGQMFADIQKISNDKELASFERLQERKRESHKRQLEQGTMSQERYNKEQERMDKELANKKAELAYKQAKAEKVSRLFSAIGSTAQAVAAALTAGGIMGPILAGIVGALGAVQIGIIASQPLPEKQSYAKGGYTKGIGFTDNSGHEVAGVVHAGEYVIPEWLLKDPQVANVAQWLESRRKGSSEEGFAEGGYTSKTDPTEKNPQKMENNEVIQRLLYILEKIEQEGIEAYVISDAKNGKEMLKAIKLYTDLINKNKH
ncbi:hypothetical protein, partial [Capnocytophaga canis]|uniref:hypothetical protein n=1 Tax=Capnocytophaga canis TaxID=1848903 RepID=UPI0005AB062C